MKSNIEYCKTCGEPFCTRCADDIYMVNCDDCFYENMRKDLSDEEADLSIITDDNTDE